MKGTASHLLEFLEGARKRFIIPVYQRNYDWKRENCKQLFDDLVSVIKEGKATHFFGSIVSYAHSRDEVILIDGQQRITTISLILIAMINAMKKGIRMASGNVIGIVNSDDWLDKNALSNVYTSVQLNMHDDDTLYCGNLIFHYNNGGEHIREASQKRLDEYAKSYDIGVFHPATFVGRKVYETVGLFDEQFKLNADTDFILRCYKEKKNFVFVPYVLSNMSDGGATNSGHTAKEMQDRKLVLKKHCKSSLEFWYLWSVYFIKIYAKRLLPHSLVVKIRSNKDK